MCYIVFCHFVCLFIFFFLLYCFFFFTQKTAYEMPISDWSSDVCSSDLPADTLHIIPAGLLVRLLLQPPQSRLVPGPLRLFLQSARFPQLGFQPVAIFLGLPPVGRSSRASNSRSVRCCELDIVFRCTFPECHIASFREAPGCVRAASG